MVIVVVFDDAVHVGDGDGDVPLDEVPPHASAARRLATTPGPPARRAAAMAAWF